MPAKRKEIVLDDKVKALLKAAATGDTSAVDMEAVQELLGSLGLKAVASGLSVVKGSRVEQQRRWMTASELTEDEVQTIKSLPDKVGVAPIITDEEPRALTQSEIDLWMDETLVERETENILKGRHEARRATLFNHATFVHDGDPYATGSFASPSNGHRFTVTKQERGGDPDLSKLEEILDEETWKAVTDKVTTRQVNEEKLQEAIASGKIPLDKFAEVIPSPTIIRVLRVDTLKDGDPV